MEKIVNLTGGIMDREIYIKDATLSYSPVISGAKGPINIYYGDSIRIEKSKNLTKNPSKSKLFVEREDDIESIKNLLESNDVAIIVNGMGGIGKTELAKNYYWKESNLENYKHFAWINYSDNIKKSFLNCFNLDLRFNDNDSIDNKFSKLVAELNTIDDDVLIFIDNFISNKDSDIFNEECEILNSFNNNIKILITSREIITSFKQLKLGFFNQEKCRELFYAYYKGDKDDEKLNVILDLVGYHTLTVELLAKTADECEYTIEELLIIVKEIGFNLNEVINEEVEHNIFTDLLFNHLLKLFSLVDLNEDEKYIMTNLSILPSRPIRRDDFKKWIGLDNNNYLNKLIKRGWINEERIDGSYYIRCHQLIQEIAREKLAPSITKCEYLINSIIQVLNTKPGENRLEKVCYLDIGASISKTIKNRTAPLDKILNSMSLLFLEIGDFKSALNYGVEACQIFERENDNYSLDLGAMYCNMANIYNANSGFQSALRYCLMSQKIFELSYDKESLSLVYNTLSICYRNIGNIDKAIKFAKKAKVIRQELCNDKLLATSYNNLSLLYLEKGDYQSSVNYLLKSKDIREQILEKYHPSLAALYNNLFTLYRSIGKCDLALDYILKAKKIVEKIYPTNHPNLVGHYSNLSIIYYQMGNNEKAFEYGIKAEKIGEQIFVEPHENMANVYSSLTAIYKDRGDLEKALYYSEKDVAICEEIYNDKHVLLSVSYNNLSMIYYELKKCQEALKYALLAKDIREKNFKEDHDKLATSYNNLMLIYSELENDSKALEYGLKSEGMFKKIFGENNLSVVSVRINLATLYLKQRIFEKSKKYFIDSEKSIKLMNNNTNFYLKHVYYGLFTIYTLKRDDKNSKKYLELFSMCQ
jgi:tetratricopeptide (TPR) repeat protein